MSKHNQIIINASGNSLKTAWRELWNSGNLIRVLTYRDLKIRYAQTYLGFLWSLLQPITGVAVVFLLFYKLAKLEASGVAYIPFALSGLILWNFFSFVLSQTAAVLINMQAMIKKIYFPKLSLPLSKVLVGAIDVGVALLIFVGVALYYQVSLLGLWAFLPALLFTIFAASGLGMLLSAFSIRFRDIQQLLPFLTQMLFFLTPVAYASVYAENLLGKDLAWLFYLNPLSGILSFLRHQLFQLPLHPFSMLSFGMALLFFVVGLISYVRAEKKMADLL